jgi:TetR/AcrR family transcriptional regulator, regulator of cefoperazone and chloramphenicol sensitivity
VRRAARAGGARRPRRTHPGAAAGTREHLLESATRLFSDRGFNAVTVRDICRDAQANVAAVNYYFGDKRGLYRAVVDRAIAVMRETSDAAIHAAATPGPAEALRHYVRIHFERLVTPTGRPGWIHSLMQRELDQPTPEAARIVDEAILPRIRFLSATVASLLNCAPDDPRIGLCAASIQTQCLFCARLFGAPGPFRALVFPDAPAGAPEATKALADHIAAFSLAGIQGLAT